MVSPVVRQFTILLFSLCFMITIVACEEAPTEEPPTISAAQLVTTTLQPPLPLVTQTALFTATLTPSISPTPSDTPTPSATFTEAPPSPTFTATPTPTLAGLISTTGAATKRVRRGPDAFDFEQIAALEAGAEIGVLGSVINDRGETWYLISFTDDEDNIVTGWIRSDLVTLDDPNLVPEVTFGENTLDAENATESPTEGPTPTPRPFESATPAQTASPTPTGATVEPSQLSNVNVRAEPGNPARCETSRPVITTNDTVSIYWSWFVYDPELMQDHISTVEYQILLDGFLITDWDRYRGTMFRDPLENNNWTVYWYAPVGQLSAGEHTLEYRATWSEPISDGRAEFGPGTANEIESGRCTFVVIEAN
ncbi:MAG: hypothetical protein CUN55_13505 [Phototrophicales bacterium]|nr:MAG: hypothetical protein CUN55_13505 [Phototrophicales bacterium]